MTSVWAGHGNPLSTLSKYVETPCQGSKLSQLPFSGQLGHPLGLALLTHNLLASSQFPPRPCKGLISILSHSHTVPLSLFYCGLPLPPICHLPAPHLMSPISHWSVQVSLGPLVLI
jgi:hypothetical protein